jgi:Mrp family chromosome partitioning ATPase
MLRLFEQNQQSAPSPAAQASAARPAWQPTATPSADLPPEVLDEPRHAEPAPVKSSPVTAPSPAAPRPEAAPLNLSPAEIARQLEPKQIAVHNQWTEDDLAGLAAQPAALVVLPEPADLHLVEPAPLVELHLDALDAAAAAPTPRHSQPEHRLHAEHEPSSRRPHVKFAPVAPPEMAAAEPSDNEPFDGNPSGRAPVAAQLERHLAEAERAAKALAEDDLTFADLDPRAADATLAAAATIEADLPPLAEPPPAASAAPSAKACIPVWEVDKFQWPVTVERLVSDKDGYFGQASGKLLAAVRDGLKTLAITGSRRGEGRTTLALSIARAAARAGIQVAVIDADFARPQLASRIGLEITHGWQDAALGKVPLSEAAIKSLADGITVLPLEVSAAGTALSLADPRVTATLRAAVATFELVILDLGPLAGGETDLFPAGEACPLDAAIVVRDLRYASLAESQSVGQRLYAAGIEAVGIAENFVVEEDAT